MFHLHATQDTDLLVAIGATEKREKCAVRENSKTNPKLFKVIVVILRMNDVLGTIDAERNETAAEPAANEREAETCDPRQRARNILSARHDLVLKTRKK
jgi:hypothetical protein